MKKQLLTLYNFETRTNELVYAVDRRIINHGVLVTNFNGSSVSAQMQEAAEILLGNRGT